MASSEDWQRLLTAWARSFKFTNMRCERLLALVRRACDCHEVDAERICSSGLLAQVLQEQRRLGRADPSCRTREQLLQDGVPVQAARRERPDRQRGAFVSWMGEQEALRRASGAQLCADAYRKWQREKAREFRELDPEVKDMYTHISRSALLDRKAHAADADAGEVDIADGCVEDVCWFFLGGGLSIFFRKFRAVTPA